MTTDDIKAPVGDPSKSCVVHGVPYKLEPAPDDTWACTGCAGLDDCLAFPPGCVISFGKPGVWVQDEIAPGKAYKPAHAGYPGDVRLD